MRKHIAWFLALVMVWQNPSIPEPTPADRDTPDTKFMRVVPDPKPSPTGIPWEEDYLKAFDKARREKKVLFILYSTDWCTYCRKLKKEQLTNPEFYNKVYDKFVFIYVDGDRANRGLKNYIQRYKPTGYPTIFLVDPVTMKVIKQMGYRRMPATAYADLVLHNSIRGK